MERRLAGVSYFDSIMIIEKGVGASFAYTNRDEEVESHFIEHKHSWVHSMPIIGISYYYFQSMKYPFNDMNKAEKIITISIATIFSTIMILAPYLFSEFFYSPSNEVYKEEFIYNILKSVGKLLFVVTYFFIISRINGSILRNHSAEHKLIACVENGEEVTPENVKKQNHFHPRCGTTFMLLDLIVGSIFFGVIDGVIKSFYPEYFLLQRIGIHLLLIPVLIFILSKLHKTYINLITKNRFLKFFITFQNLTLREADDKAIDLAIRSYQHLEESKSKLSV